MLKENEVLQVRTDRLFHDLFNENDMNTLEWTVMQILGCSYMDIHGKVMIRNIRLTNINSIQKSKYVDLIVDYKNEKIIIELNNNYNGNYLRNVLYAFNVLSNEYNLDNKYSDYYNKKVNVILVNLNWYKSKNKSKNRNAKHEYLYEYPDEEYDDYLLKIINVNLDYYEKKCYTEINECDKLWKLLTINSKEELNMLIENEKLLKHYEKKLINLSKDKEYCEEYMNETIERNLEYMNSYRDGLIDGEEKTKIKFIINMYHNNISIDKISEISKLSAEKIKEIINSIDESNNQ